MYSNNDDDDDDDDAVFVGRRCIGTPRWAASATVCLDRVV